MSSIDKKIEFIRAYYIGKKNVNSVEFIFFKSNSGNRLSEQEMEILRQGGFPIDWQVRVHYHKNSRTVGHGKTLEQALDSTISKI